jgi:hypothetical protein
MCQVRFNVVLRAFNRLLLFKFQLPANLFLIEVVKFNLIDIPMKKIILLASITALGATSAFALNASDNASNYADGWTDGSNGGFGFNPWGFTTTADNVVAIENSTGGAGDINTSGNSFSIASGNGGSFDVFRSFGGAASLGAGDVFTLDMSVNFRNGNKGLDLRNGGTGLFNFNTGGGGVGGAETYFFGGVDLGAEGWGYVSDGAYSLEFAFVTETIINAKITRTSLTDITREYELTGVDLGSSVDNFKFYVSGTGDAAAENRLYVNNLTVVPEPGTYALFAGLLALAWVATRRR